MLRFPLWKDPSEAMKAWMEVDSRWHQNQDYITGGGGDLISATAYADAEALDWYKAQENLEMAETTNNVVDLDSKRKKEPYLKGKARCLTCKHEWVAVHPIPMEWMECPSCGCRKGWMKNPVVYSQLPHWMCKCGNDLFQITPYGSYCPNCGGGGPPS